MPYIEAISLMYGNKSQKTLRALCGSNDPVEDGRVGEDNRYSENTCFTRMSR